MIKVERLTKRYGSTTAVDAINFEVEKGEIVGMLGPNGAGKSTTVRMLACYLPPTSGRAEVAGFDVFRDSLRAREHIGYMPEHVPLPHDMRVNEYLAFRAALKGVPGRRVKERLADVSNHEPELLILDEPTIGLDPNQIRQVRELIKNLRRHHTILLSTHILSEVEMICSRVIIINRGRIEALDTPENLRARIGSQGEVIMEARTEDPQAIAKLRSVIGVKDVVQKKMEDWTRFTLHVESDPREDLYALAVKEGWPLRELTRRGATLEQVFAEVTHAEEQE